MSPGCGDGIGGEFGPGTLEYDVPKNQVFLWNHHWWVFLGWSHVKTLAEDGGDSSICTPTWTHSGANGRGDAVMTVVENGSH